MRRIMLTILLGMAIMFSFSQASADMVTELNISTLILYSTSINS
jgi:hypothetical protein